MVPDNISITFEIVLVYANGDSVNASECFGTIAKSYKDRDEAEKIFRELLTYIAPEASHLLTHKIIQAKIVELDHRQTTLDQRWFEMYICKKALVSLLEESTVLEAGCYSRKVKRISEETVELTNGLIFDLEGAKLCGNSLGLMYRGETTWFNVYRQVKPHVNGIVEIISKHK